MNDTLEHQLFRFLDSSRGAVPIEQTLRGWVAAANDVLSRRARLEIWIKTVGSGHARSGGDFLSSPEVAAFMAALGGVQPGVSVLDPACGSGLLLALAAERTAATVINGVDINAGAAALAPLLLPATAQVVHGNCLNADPFTNLSYDLVISEPPFNAPLGPEAHRPISGIKDVGQALFVWAANKLSPNGRLVFLFPASVAGEPIRRLAQALNSAGVQIRALVHVPAGSLKAANIASYIVVADRTPRTKIFTAQYSADHAHQKQLLENFQSHKAGNRPAQGRLSSLNDFRGFVALEAAELLASSARRKGFSPIHFKDLVAEHQVMKAAAASAVDGANDFYLPLMGNGPAVLRPEQVTAKSVKLVRLVVRPEIVDPRYLVALLNDDMGRQFLDTLRSGTAVAQISVEDLLAGTIYLPTLPVQKKALEAVVRISALRAELDQIEAEIWSQPAKLDLQVQQLKKVNHEDTFEGWLETLPFPLASILWRYRASHGSSKERNEILIHYFEALAEFWATLYLSAAKSDREFWAEHVSGLDNCLREAKLTYERATFGLWKNVVEYFGKRFRHLLAEEPERCRRMFASPSQSVLSMLCDRIIVTVLQSANSARNRDAHGGVQSAAEADSVHEQLKELLQKCRGMMGTTWEGYELLQPGECRFTGGVFIYKARRVMGSRSLFATVERNTIEAMDDGALYLIDPEGDRGLKLLPFVRVMPSPKTEANACYFYNRNEHRQHLFVSYHFEADAEVERFFADTQTALGKRRPECLLTGR